jgi:hypothetical protein
MKSKFKCIIALFFLITLSNNSFAQAQKRADKDTEAWKYEIEAVQTGVQGTYLFKVWSYSKKPDVAIEQSKKNAIHGIIFKGFTGKTGVPGQSPLVNNVNLEEEKADFFKPFFNEGGKYMKFVSLSNDGAVAAEDRMKIGKEYKIGLIVAVNVAELRKDLENAGIIRSLSSGF